MLSYLPANNLEEAPYEPTNDEINRLSEKLTTIVPDDSGKAYDVKEVIAELVDNGDFFEVQEGFAKNIVIGFAR